MMKHFYILSYLLAFCLMGSCGENNEDTAQEYCDKMKACINEIDLAECTQLVTKVLNKADENCKADFRVAVDCVKKAPNCEKIYNECSNDDDDARESCKTYIDNNENES